MNVIAIMNHMGFTSKKNPSVNCIVLSNARTSVLSTRTTVTTY